MLAKVPAGNRQNDDDGVAKPREATRRREHSEYKRNRFERIRRYENLVFESC